MKQRLYRSIINLANGPNISRTLWRFANSNLSRPLIKPYARVYRINLEEMRDDLKSYRNLHSFFTRKIKEELRPIDSCDQTVVCPVDGILEDYGEIALDSEITVKNKNYSINEMLGGSDRAARYSGGTFMILYLSPSHYHRIHAPITGKITRTYTLGQKSFPVNKYGLKYGDATLAKNYRIVTELENDSVSIAMVKVGATFINSVEIINQKDVWEKGEEVAYFSFGSTVVLLFEKGAFKLNESIVIPADVRMGQSLGNIRQK